MTAATAIRVVASRAAGWLLTAAVLMLAIMGIWTVGPALESRFWPVVEPLEITRVEPVGQDQTRIWIRFQKRRVCSPIGVFWYRGTRDGLFEPVRFIVERRGAGGQGYVNRPLGAQESGPWLIDLPMRDVQDRAFADAQHTCWPLWPTISRFYR